MTQVHQSAGGALLRALLDEVQQQRALWKNLPEVDQQNVINRLRSAVDKAVRQTVRIVASAGFNGVAVQLKSIDIREPTKVTVLVADEGSLHALVDHRKAACVLSFAPDLDQFTDGMEAIKADADQPELPLGDDDPGFAFDETGTDTGSTEGQTAAEEPGQQPQDDAPAAADAEAPSIEQSNYAAERAAADESPADDSLVEAAERDSDAAMAERALKYPDMTAEEAQHILATSEVVDERTERAMDILIRRPPPYKTDPAVTAANDAALAARAAERTAVNE